MRYDMRGQNVIRLGIVKALSKSSGDDPLELARLRYGNRSDVLQFMKASIGGFTSADGADLLTQDVGQLIELVREKTILRTGDYREVPFMKSVVAMTAGSRGFWTGQHKPIPLSKPAIDGEHLRRRYVCAVVVLTEESLDDPRLEQIVQNDMVRALAEAVDEAFIDPDNAGIIDVMPASITNGIPPISGTGDPVADIQALVAAFQGDLDSAVFVSDPITLSQIALWRDSGGSFAFPDLGVRGGSLLGLPVISSRSSPRNSEGGQLALLDPTGIALAMDSIEIARTDVGMLTMSDDPENEASTRISLFQSDAIALKARISANWSVQRVGGVAAIAGATYG